MRTKHIKTQRHWVTTEMLTYFHCWENKNKQVCLCCERGNISVVLLWLCSHNERFISCTNKSQISRWSHPHVSQTFCFTVLQALSLLLLCPVFCSLKFSIIIAISTRRPPPPSHFRSFLEYSTTSWILDTWVRRSLLLPWRWLAWICNRCSSWLDRLGLLKKLGPFSINVREYIY